MNNGTRLVGAAGALTVVGVLIVSSLSVREGVRLNTYRDTRGIPTICFGETRGVRMGDKYTLKECQDKLHTALVGTYEKGMRKCLKNPDAIPDLSYVAFLSFTYNVGVGGWCRSKTAKMANTGNLKAACYALMGWVKPREITGRRREEVKQCLQGVKDGNVTVNAPVKQEAPTPPEDTQ